MAAEQGIDTFLAALKAGQAFPVVITDLGMPHVDGRAVAAAIEAVAPDTPRSSCSPAGASG